MRSSILKLLSADATVPSALRKILKTKTEVLIFNSEKLWFYGKRFFA